MTFYAVVAPHVPNHLDKSPFWLLDQHVYETHAEAEAAADAVNRSRKHHGYPPVSIARIEVL